MEQPPKLPPTAALTDVNFEKEHTELRNQLQVLTELAGKADPLAMPKALSAKSCINNLFANLDARIQVLEQLAIRDGKYPTEYE